MKKIHEMTEQMIKACILRCPIKLPSDVGIANGNVFAYIKNEVSKKFVKAAKEDLRLRQMHLKTATNEFCGDFGRVKIGGKMFTWYPYSGMLVRDDFAQWAEKHIMEVWNFQRGCENLPDKDESGVEVTVEPQLKMYKDIRKRAMNILPIIDLIEPVCRNSIYDMKKKLKEYLNDIEKVEAHGKCYIITKAMADLLSAVIAYREKQNALAIDFLLDLSASALKAAQFIQEKANKEK